MPRTTASIIVPLALATSSAASSLRPSSARPTKDAGAARSSRGTADRGGGSGRPARVVRDLIGHLHARGIHTGIDEHLLDEAVRTIHREIASAAPLVREHGEA
ncbi:hypothetical protein [Amycolatopsis sp. lyj-109]|uniref:hypothetical protein n=1 Tax=Amycolatopsis sp. lyj-109 TaxID=2789287 RepID=UPI00397C3408